MSKVGVEGEDEVAPVRPQFIRTAWGRTRLCYSLWSPCSLQLSPGGLDGTFQSLMLNTAATCRWKVLTAIKLSCAADSTGSTCLPDPNGH